MLKALSRATALAAALAGISWLAAIRVLGNLYYLGILVPASALSCLLLAWLLYLRRDGFIRAPGHEAAARREAGSGLHLDPGLVPHEGGAGAGRSRGDPAGASRALAWAAAELVILSLVLYRFAGIGASFYR